MANWITHSILADLVFAQCPWLDERAFCVGNVAPDCNMPSGEGFIPSRERTHFMDGKDKLSALYDLFFSEYVEGRSFSDREEYSFLLGYYAHLIADVEYLRFCRDREQLRRMFARIRENPTMAQKLDGGEESFMTLRNAFGKERVFSDIVRMENDHVRENPDCSYNRILRHVGFFPNYLDFFPENHYAEKIAMMLRKYDETQSVQSDFLFYTRTEYHGYLRHVSETVCDRIGRRVPVCV